MIFETDKGPPGEVPQIEHYSEAISRYIIDQTIYQHPRIMVANTIKNVTPYIAILG